MWVSRRDWDALVARVNELDKRHEGYVHQNFFTVYDPKREWGYYHDKQHIEVKEVVRQILHHLGMVLTYRRGSQSGVDIKKQEDAARSES